MPDTKELLQFLLKGYQQKRATLSEEETQQLTSESNEKLCDIISLCSLILSNRAMNDDPEALKKVHESTTAVTCYLEYAWIAEKKNLMQCTMDLSSWPINISASAWAHRPINNRNTSLYDYLGLTRIPDKLGSNLPLTEIRPHSQALNWPNAVFQMGYNAVYLMRFPEASKCKAEEHADLVPFPVKRSEDPAHIDFLVELSSGLRGRIQELPKPNDEVAPQWAEAIIDYLGLWSGWGEKSLLKNFLSTTENEKFKLKLREARLLLNKNICRRLRKVGPFSKTGTEPGLHKPSP